MARIRAAARESEGGAATTSERASTASQGRTQAAYRYYTSRMTMKSIRAWLGLDRPETPEPAPLRDVLAALDHLEPARARYLAAFAYLLGRVAHADQHVSRVKAGDRNALIYLVLNQSRRCSLRIAKPTTSVRGRRFSHRPRLCRDGDL